ncbi:dihydroorotate dehydrogenase electron transfer subunit [Clostridium algifaecis]|uniref:dihydroorotate dehydrogenase electron transfer subunit n=1 Tax=Clostridium algifaecis TaxID=1472040 RepID=UPI001AE5E99D|nr:dihydroorotate dehydrogenase electron transfer subunit [Clostridium algifaecis]
MEKIQLENKLDYITCKVAKNENINDNIYKFEFNGNFKGKPGQFYMLRAWDKEPLLSRPISINYLDDEKIVFLYQVVGTGTKKLSLLKEDDEVKLMGPLGNGFDIDNIDGKVAMISGGIGIAPMLYLAKILSEKSSKKDMQLDLYAGFKKETYILDRFDDFVDNIYYSLETGKSENKGFITDIFHPQLYDMVLCCGPGPMMMRVVTMCREKNIPVYVSMENHMACGVGACLVCTCKTKHGNKRTCVDGPVFLGEDLVL